MEQVRLLRQKDTGRSRGMAYIEFADEAGVAAAVRLAGQDLRGRRLNVAKSKPTAPRHTDGGPGGGRGGRGCVGGG